MAARGRPRSFDRDAALRSAMDAFSVRGYDGTSLEDLLTAMGGLTPPSFYAAFGSKEALFEEVIDLYRRTVGEGPTQALERSPVRAGIEGMLRAAVETFDSPEGGHGCLLVLGAPTRTRTNGPVHERLREMRCQAPEMIRRRLERAVVEGELSAAARLDDIAAFYTTVAHGLAIAARDGASHRTLLAVVDGAMAAWDTVTTRTAKRSASTRKRTAHKLRAKRKGSGKRG